LPVTSSALHWKVDGVTIRLSLTATLDRDEAASFQLSNEFGNAASAHAHVGRQAFLAGKAGIIVPGVTQEHGVSDFRSDRQVGLLEDEVGHLGKAPLRDRVCCVQLNIPFLNQFSN
jgi:hypothetical protein